MIWIDGWLMSGSIIFCFRHFFGNIQRFGDRESYRSISSVLFDFVLSGHPIGHVIAGAGEKIMGWIESNDLSERLVHCIPLTDQFSGVRSEPIEWSVIAGRAERHTRPTVQVLGVRTPSQVKIAVQIVFDWLQATLLPKANGVQHIHFGSVARQSYQSAVGRELDWVDATAQSVLLDYSRLKRSFVVISHIVQTQRWVAM